MKTQGILAGAALLALAACGGNDATEESRGESKEVATATEPNGETGMLVVGGAAADALPDFAPLYPGAKVTSGAGGDADGGVGGMVSFETSDAAEKVVGWYKEQVGRAGMTVVTEMTRGDSHMLIAEDEAKTRSLEVDMAPRDGGGSAGTLVAGAR